MKNRTTGFTNCARYKCLEDLDNNVSDLQLAYCGREQCVAGHRFGPNRRDCWVLHVVQEGEGHLEMNGEVYRMSAGDAFVIRPHQEAWYEADMKNPWSYFWIGFTGVDSEICVSKAGFTDSQPVRRIECTDQLRVWLDGMLEAHQLSYADTLKRTGLLLMFFSALISDSSRLMNARQGYSYPSTTYVKYVRNYIERYYSDRISIGELAEFIGVNRSYLTNSFKKETGCSPQEYLLNVRMKKAQTMLRQGNRPVGEIASKVGYQDPLAFSRIFHQRNGMSPRQYRRMDEELVLSRQKGDYSQRIF